jgi:hypothetical protein
MCRSIIGGARIEVIYRRAFYVFQGKVLEQINKKTEVKITTTKSSYSING